MTASRTALDRAVGVLRATLAVGTAVLLALAAAVTAVVPAHPWGAAAMGAGAAVLLAAATAWTTAHALRGPDALVGWVAGGYLLKGAVVVAALLGSRAAGIGPRWTALWVILAVLGCAGSEVGVLARARVGAVDPPASGGDPRATH